ncbi:hypothetical protein V495_05212 [Pseudogymnoascus sp. VKM F-4514 (FW-929)]|nr:hypothetical protein V490_02903 [Pseudogymnoascus sp. VKM F-3557]KFY40870.1 hypothetical protein V495_05212 [Pseudogymnoascus sp. VKM F-4514 (FW-929)]KFY61339.1 hypothetical protein V497_03019 [Pseudogymnoascus sp. VKM F-4516 (FW-969)]
MDAPTSVSMETPTAAAVPTTTNLPVETPAPTATNLLTDNPTPTPTTTIPTAQAPKLRCHICIQMQIRRPLWTQPGPTKECLLCVRQYCSKHAAPSEEVRGEEVCEINHKAYYRKHPQRWIEGVVATLEDLE